MIQTKYLWTKCEFVQIKYISALNQTNYLSPYTNAMTCLFLRKIYLIQINIYIAQRYSVGMKQMLFHSNKSFLWIKKSLSNKLFSFIQSDIFSERTVKNVTNMISLSFDFSTN